ncbi:hypothetical protein BSKO_01309 [Bryopsis sp. KO-2023]|nr:hypothetical protein BSKO_01309 [Bryopsis sp. KO-2023]
MALRRLAGHVSMARQLYALREACAGLGAWSASTQLEEPETATNSHDARPQIRAAMEPFPDPSTPLYDRSLRADGRFLYRVHVATGNVRGAGTGCSVMVKLIGTRGESEEFHIGVKRGFDRDSLETVVLSVSKDLGQLKMVLVKRDEGGVSDTGAGWFLEKMLVYGPKGENWSFPCMQWFGDSDDGDVSGPLERHLVPSTFADHEDKIMEPQPVRITASGMAIPHPDKVVNGIKGINRNQRGRGGEDSYFYTFGQNGIFGMGVADGVFGMRAFGIDSGVFSSTLMDRAFHMVKRGYDDVVAVLKTVSRYVETEGVYGSSTCCLLTVNMNQGRLNSANLGDSGFMVIGSRVYRPEVHVTFRTPQQEHEFGCPYALGHHKHAASPNDAMLESLQLYPGDTIVMGSDGLFDNVFVSEVVKQVKTFREEGKGPQALVHKLTEIAHVSSTDNAIDTPYSRGYTDFFDLAMSGGKPDDITILVAYLS